MSADASLPSPQASPELIITRVFNVPRQLVWNAWRDPKQMAQWMGPREFTACNLEGDFRPGGSWRSCLRPIAGGENLWNGGVYREIVEPERLTFTFAWDGDDGRPENEMLITLLFEEEQGKTKMTLHQTAFRSVEQRDGHRGGWSSTFDRLEEFLTKG
jgi:uncharacterized protein YndB with AHSA1/START domain